jgi:hypothetical protein
VALGIQAKEFNLGFIRPDNIVSHGLRVFRCLLANSKWAVKCLLLRSGQSTTLADWWSAAEMVVLLEGYPISRMINGNRMHLNSILSLIYIFYQVSY